MARANVRPRPQGAEKTPGRRPAKPPTRRRLANIAAFYLKRFSSSAENLRRVLRRRILKMTLTAPELRTQAFADAEAVVASLLASGALDDERYAAGKARFDRALRKPRAKTAAKLRAKGIAAATIDRVLSESHDADADFDAGLAIARRRRLGPFRTQRDRDSDRRDLAALARAGLDFKTAKRVMAWSED